MKKQNSFAGSAAKNTLLRAYSLRRRAAVLPLCRRLLLDRIPLNLSANRGRHCGGVRTTVAQAQRLGESDPAPVAGCACWDAWSQQSGTASVLIRGHHSAHGGRSGAAAAVPAIAEKLLDPFCGIDFPCINVALAVHAHLMQVVEVSRHPASAAEPAQLLQIASVQDVDGHVGVVADIETALRLVRGEVH